MRDDGSVIVLAHVWGDAHAIAGPTIIPSAATATEHCGSMRTGSTAIHQVSRNSATRLRVSDYSTFRRSQVSPQSLSSA